MNCIGLWSPIGNRRVPLGVATVAGAAAAGACVGAAGGRARSGSSSSEFPAASPASSFSVQGAHSVGTHHASESSRTVSLQRDRCHCIDIANPRHRRYRRRVLRAESCAAQRGSGAAAGRRGMRCVGCVPRGVCFCFCASAISSAVCVCVAVFRVQDRARDRAPCPPGVGRAWQRVWTVVT